MLAEWRSSLREAQEVSADNKISQNTSLQILALLPCKLIRSAHREFYTSRALEQSLSALSKSSLQELELATGVDQHTIAQHTTHLVRRRDQLYSKTFIQQVTQHVANSLHKLEVIHLNKLAQHFDINTQDLVELCVEPYLHELNAYLEQHTLYSKSFKAKKIAQLKGRLRAATAPIMLLQRTDIRISNEKITKLIEQGQVNGKFEASNLVYTPKLFERIVLDYCVRFWKANSFLPLSRLEAVSEKENGYRKFIEISKSDEKEIVMFTGALISRKLVEELVAEITQDLENEKYCDMNLVFPNDFPMSDRRQLATELYKKIDETKYPKLSEFCVVEGDWMENIRKGIIESVENLALQNATLLHTKNKSSGQIELFNRSTLDDLISKIYPDLDSSFSFILRDNIFSACEKSYKATYSECKHSLKSQIESESTPLLFKDNSLLNQPGIRKKSSNLNARLSSLFEHFQVFSRGIVKCYDVKAFKNALIIQELENHLISSLGTPIIDCILLMYSISSNVLLDELEFDIDQFNSFISQPIILREPRRSEAVKMLPLENNELLNELIEKKVCFFLF
jgi:hypothetical protein